ncbi:hypothetical protein [Cytobacillus purgationiresistens]|uniref:Uncharacterized protein n=1 Tax=Cytobacillus purgationiresistens TaxID=863449 RepID=A0ABU0AFA9_9BACI|nr:hypothetical protein [Cytobacillus purgationiresistens]MDQ0269715.1 hypothetical protein [Cytobacillus purgationiresistens]
MANNDLFKLHPASTIVDLGFVNNLVSNILVQETPGAGLPITAPAPRSGLRAELWEIVGSLVEIITTADL